MFFFWLFFVHELKIVRQQDDVKTKGDAARVVAGYHCWMEGKGRRSVLFTKCCCWYYFSCFSFSLFLIFPWLDGFWSGWVVVWSGLVWSGLIWRAALCFVFTLLCYSFYFDHIYSLTPLLLLLFVLAWSSRCLLLPYLLPKYFIHTYLHIPIIILHHYLLYFIYSDIWLCVCLSVYQGCGIYIGLFFRLHFLILVYFFYFFIYATQPATEQRPPFYT